MPKDGKIYINADDEALMKTDWEREVITVGFSEKADYRASDVEISAEKGFSYTVHYKGKTERIKLNVLGRHNVYNSLYSFAIADDLELPVSKVLKGIADFKTFGVRQNLIKSGSNLILLDCFNAAPASMKTALSTINDIKTVGDGKRIAFLADMTEFGEISESVHKEVSEYINQNGGIDILVTHGEYAKIIGETVTRKDIEIIHSDDKEYLKKLLKSYKGKNNVFLFKGSRAMKLEELVKSVFPFKYFTKVFLSDLLLFHDI